MRRICYSLQFIKVSLLRLRILGNKKNKMKKYIVIAIFILLPYIVNAQCTIWTAGNAQTVKQSSLEASVFQNTRYGITRSFEIGAQPLAMVLLPNIYAKKQWYNEKNLMITSRHGLYYPGIAMKFAQNKGQTFPERMKIARDTIFPANNILKGNPTLTNELLVSTFLQPPSSCSAANLLLTGKVGLHLTLVADEQIADSIFYPVLYARTQPYHKQAMWYVGAQLDGHFFLENVDFSTDVQFVSSGMLSAWSIEHKGLLLWTKFKNIRLLGGYKLAYATFEGQSSRLKFMPAIDFTYLFQFKGNKKVRGGDLKGTRGGQSSKSKKNKKER